VRFGLYLNTQDPPRAEHLPALYREIFETVELAEAAGFDACFVPEHHQFEDGYLPSPLLLLSAIAARTTKIRLGTSVLQLPLRHPLAVAEDVGVLDNLSNGRVILGVGLGWVDREFAQFGVDKQRAVTRLEEGIEILKLAMANDVVSFDGSEFSFADVGAYPKPVQQPRPPIWIGAMNERGIDRAARIADGWILDQIHGLELAAEWSARFLDGAREHGTPGEVVILREGWIADSADEIEREWWPHVRADNLNYLAAGFFAGNTFAGDVLSTITDPEKWTYERVAPDRFLVGTPQQVVGQLREIGTHCGCEYVVMHFRHRTGPSHEATLRCIERFGEEVIPALAS
jgi:probable F420-dependent oxidoreductase